MSQPRSITGKWLSPEERTALGRSQRKHTPRQQHEQWQAKLRRQNAAELLRHSMRGRVSALVTLKYQRMMASPFGYFRGAVPVMAADLALLPRTGIFSQLCGDAHVSNLGSYLGADGIVVFDINDFDETIPGPFEWDLKRLATSIVLAGRNAGASDTVNEEAVHACIASYTRLIAMFSQMSILDIAHHRVHRLNAVKPVADILRMSARATPQHSLDQFTQRSSNARNGDALARRRFHDARPDLWRITGKEASGVLASLTLYKQNLPCAAQHFFAQYRPIDVAFKVVGTGSVGLRDYVVLLEGNGSQDPLFLQVKEEVASGYAPYLKGHTSHDVHNGRRVAHGQQTMQLQSDPFLGWTQMRGRDYLVRQLNDHKAEIDIAKLKGAALVAYAEVCGELLARGHARSGDACRIGGYIGRGSRFCSALSRFALRYADQTELDWKALVRSHPK
jgi:uncharacterized protein (DUF2252 family)